MVFIDVHCHLDERFYNKKEIEEIIERAEKSGVEIVIANGIGSKENRNILRLSEKYKIIKAALGVHPTENLENIEKEISFIEKNSDKIIAIGEVGLDFLDENADKEKQKKAFKKFIELAKKLDKPMIVHSRKAEKECIEILESSGFNKIVMHCFSGKKGLIDNIAGNGWFLSVPASVKYNEHFQNLVKRVNIKQLLCETDSPFLTPSREGKNEPSFVVEGYKKIAELKKMDLNETEKQIEENYKKLFQDKEVKNNKDNN